MCRTSNGQRTVNQRTCNGSITDTTDMYRIRYGQNVRRTIKECACDIRPWNSVTCPEVDRSQLRSNEHQPIHTGYLQDADHMRNRQTEREPDNRIPTHE